jgi:ribosome-binding factor A
VAAPLRRERVAAQIRMELSDIVQHHIRDPRLGWATITRVEMSPDLCYAKVFISVYGDEQARKRTFDVLEHALGFIRRELARRVRMRQAPEIHFKPDESIEQSQRVGEILRGIEIPPAEPETGESRADDEEDPEGEPEEDGEADVEEDER